MERTKNKVRLGDVKLEAPIAMADHHEEAGISKLKPQALNTYRPIVELFLSYRECVSFYRHTKFKR